MKGRPADDPKPRQWGPGDCGVCQYLCSLVNGPNPCPDHVADYQAITDWRNRLRERADLDGAR